MKIKKIFTTVAVAGLFVAAGITAYVYNVAFTPNTTFNQKEVYVYIPTNATYQMVQEELTPFIKDMSKFNFVANKRNYNNNIIAGKFLLEQNMTSFDIVRALRMKKPVKVAFNNQESLSNLTLRLSSQLEPDSLALDVAFTNTPFLEKNGFNKENILAMFIPNTYEFYWDISPDKLADKLAKEYKKFWNEERLAKAEAMKLTPIEVSILASIVHKETVKADERPRVAGVYLNRLALGMPLQADPTVIFAIKKQSGDFNQIIKRVFHNDLRINSPYNTYINTGLPPGPIAMPDISAIDAVLNAEKHDFIYFCASVEKFGYHDFASNYAQHQVNARKYSVWIASLGINR